ncbi:MAG: type VI secretion system baseplate subunit TssF [Aquabacterium sp.]
MRALLPYFENELTSLRRRGQAFAQAFPRIAGQLHWGADEAKDPHVERMIESFALLSARVHKRLDDDFPLFVESLLEVLYPHYLRPFPSCSIAQFDLGTAAGQLSKPAVVPRGTLLHARPVKGVACRFRTSHDLQLMPLDVVSATYRNAIAAPEGTRLPASVTSVLSLSLSLTSPQVTWATLGNRTLRIYLDGEPSQVSALREALCHKVRAIMVDTGTSRVWQSLPERDGHASLPTLAGFDEAEALIDGDARSHTAYRLLTEYFAFPEKFNFIDLPLPVVHAPHGTGPQEQAHATGAKTLTLHLLMSGVRGDSDESRMLEAVHARNVLLGCVPVVNLFKQPADPIRVTHARSAYPVVVDARRAYGYEVYGIDKVFRIRQTPHGESTEEFKPFFSLQHEELLAVDDADEDALSAPTLAMHRSARSSKDADGARAGAGGRYWSTHRDEDVAAESPGYELEISIVDVDFDPAQPQTDTLSLTVTATNRELPSLLPFGAPGGDLFIEGGGVAREVRLLRKPTPPMRFDRGRGALWRLISHLSLNHLSLSGGGIDALKEMLRLYDLPRSPSNRRQIDGLLSVDFRPATAWLPGDPYATFVRGTEIRLTVDEDSFVGTGLGLFASVLDRFFALYVHANSFTQLTLLSSRTQEEVFSCPPRNGDMPLV